jgi:hypothetical protein
MGFETSRTSGIAERMVSGFWGFGNWQPAQSAGPAL